MKIYTFIFLILLLISFVYLKLAKRFEITDTPDQRSSHSKITISGGGIIFPIAILLFFFLNDYQYPYFVLGVFLISVVSFLDDIYTLSSKIRFPFHFLAIFLVLYQMSFSFVPIYMHVFFLIVGVGIVNMFNFMDGINGITGIYSLVVLSGFFFINKNELLVNQDLIIFSAISLVVFGFYNFRRKALVFAGDIGSIVIGMLIFFIGFIFTINLSSPLILLLTIVYGADAGFTLLYRKFFTNENIFDPHRHHIYQKIVDVYKISHLKISFIYGILQLIINYIVFKTYGSQLRFQLIVFFGLIIAFGCTYFLIFRIIKNRITR